MTRAPHVPANLVQLCEQLVEGAPAASGVRALRQRAWDWFAARGLPTAKDEAWKYTRLDAWQRLELRTAPATLQQATSVLARRAMEPPQTSFLLANGYVVARPEAMPRGVEVSTWGDGGVPAQVWRDLQADAQATQPPMRNLHAALFTDGVHLEVAEGVELDVPLVLLEVAVPLGGHTWSAPRHSLRLAPRARATVVSCAVGADAAPGATLAGMHVVLGEGARLDLLQLSLDTPGLHRVEQVHAVLEAGATMNAWTTTLGQPLARHGLHVRLDGEGAAVSLCGLQLARSEDHVDHLTHVVHAVPGCRSDQHIRGIATERSHVVFTGTVRVAPGADRTEAHQRDANLLLSSDAEVDTRPELEIFADDVQCTHGATVGALDDDAVFYLRSRGLNEATARTLLTWGFAAAVLPAAQGPQAWAAEHMRREVRRWLVSLDSAPRPR